MIEGVNDEDAIMLLTEPHFNRYNRSIDLAQVTWRWRWSTREIKRTDPIGSRLDRRA